MGDVAKAAGISRQTLYNTVSGREELLEAVMVWRIGEIAELLRETAAGQETIADAIVEMSVAAVEIGLGDPELTHLVETAGSARLFGMIAGPVPAVHHLVGRLVPARSSTRHATAASCGPSSATTSSSNGFA